MALSHNVSLMKIFLFYVHCHRYEVEKLMKVIPQNPVGRICSTERSKHNK